MRTGPSSAVLAAGVGYEVLADSYLGGELLAESIPVSGGTFTSDSDQEVVESATLAVAALADGRLWVPGDDARHPLARFGQELALRAHMWVGDRSWETPIGRVRIDEWKEDDAEVEVKASGVLQFVKDARLPRPIVPRKDGTLESELRRLMLPGIPLAISPLLANRACPSSFTWDEDRLGAIYNIVDVWPARLLPDGFGGFNLVPEIDEAAWAPVFTFTDGEGGTAVRTPRADTRDRCYNHVIARTQSDAQDAPVIQGEAYVTEGKYAITGPYRDVPAFFSSPVLRTEAQCTDAARSQLVQYLLPSSTVTVRAAVDPRIELLDPVEVIATDGTVYRGWVIAVKLPLVLGDMEITVGVL